MNKYYNIKYQTFKRLKKNTVNELQNFYILGQFKFENMVEKLPIKDTQVVYIQKCT